MPGECRAGKKSKNGSLPEPAMNNPSVQVSATAGRSRTGQRCLSPRPSRLGPKLPVRLVSGRRPGDSMGRGSFRQAWWLSSMGHGESKAESVPVRRMGTNSLQNQRIRSATGAVSTKTCKGSRQANRGPTGLPRHPPICHRLQPCNSGWRSWSGAGATAASPACGSAHKAAGPPRSRRPAGHPVPPARPRAA